MCIPFLASLNVVSFILNIVRNSTLRTQYNLIILKISLIFKTIDEETTLNSKKVVNVLHARKSTQQQAARQLKMDVACLREYEKVCMDGFITTENFTKTMGKASKQAQDYAIKIKNGTGSAKVYEDTQKKVQSSINDTSATAQIASVGIHALSSTLNTLAGSAIMWGINKIADWIEYLSTATQRTIETSKKIRENFSNYFSTYLSERETLESFREEYEILTKRINENGNVIGLSANEYERYREITTEILNICPQLITGWDNEGRAISNNNNLLQDSIALLDEEHEKKLRNATTKASNKKIAAGIIKEIETFNNQADTKTHSGTTNEMKGDFEKELRNVDNKRKNLNDYDIAKKMYNYLYPKGKGLQLKGVYGGWIGSLMSEIYDNNENDDVKLAKSFSDKKNPIYQLFDKKVIDRMVQNAENYLDEVTRIKDERDMLYQKFEDQINLNVQTVDGYTDLTPNVKAFVNQYIKNLDYAKIKSTDDFLTMVNNTKTFAKSLVDNPILQNQIENLYSLSEKNLPVNEYVAQYQAILNSIQEYCDEHNIKFPIVFSANINDVEKSYENAITKFGERDRAIIDIFFQEHSINDISEIDFWNKTTKDAKNAFEAMKMYRDSKHLYADKYKRNKGTKNSPSVEKRWEESKKTHASQESSKTRKTARKYQLSSMKKGMSAITGALNEKEKNYSDKKTRKIGVSSDTLAGFDAEIKGLDSWEEFERTLGNGKKSMNQCRKAANKLATEWIESNNFLANLNDTNKDNYIYSLKNMGVKNAEQIVLETLNNKINAQNNLEKAAKEEKVSLTNATWDQITASDTYEEASKKARKAMAELFAEQKILSNTKLNLQQKVNELHKFAKATLTAAEASAIADQTMHDVAKEQKPGWNTKDYQKSYNKNYIKNFKKKMKEIDFIFETDSESDSTDTNETKKTKKQKQEKPKEPKQEINWMDRKITVLNNKLSETQKRYDAIAASMKKIDSSAMVRKENANLEKQIRILKKLRSTYGRQESKYQSRANNYVKKNFKGKSNEKLRSNIKNGKIKGSYSSLVKKYGQEKANKIQTAIDLYDKASTARQNKVDASKQIRDNEIQQHQNRADLTQKKIDKYAARAELVHLSKKNKYIDNEITQTKKLYSHQIDIAKLNRDNEEVAKLEAEQKKKIRDLEIEKLQNLADEGEESYNLYKTQASMTTNHKDRNKLAKNVTDSLRKQYSNLIKIADEEGNIAEKNRLQLELQQKLNEESKERIQNVSEDYENRLIGNSRQMQVWNNAASLAEAKGKTVNAKFYDQMASVAGQEEKKRKNEVDDAWNTYYEQMRDNPNFINSQEWYDAIQIINDASDAYEQAQINAEQYKQKAIEANWAIADSAKQAIDHLNSEAEAYKSIFGYKDMYDKDGRLTDAGTATFALNVYGIENSTDRIEKINEEIDALTEQYKAGDISIEKYNERMQELRDDALNTAESIYSLRDGMKSLIEEGLNAEMDALNESIDKVKQNLSDASNLREYQKNIEKQTKNIASLERQISAKSGDMSEKGRADLQKLKVQLEDAKSELEDTEYDKYIEDQERILDDMAEDFQNHIDAQLKDVNNLLQGIIDSIGKGEPSISKILQDLSKEIGVDLSKVLSENLDLFATTGKTNAGDVYDNTVKDYNNSANAEYKNGENTKVMNTDDKKGTVETNGQASDPAYQKTSAWLKSKGFSDKDIETMYGSLDNAQKIFSGIQNAGGNASARDIFKTYQKGNVDASKGFSKFEETDAYANEINELLNLANEKKAEIKEKENLEEKNKRKTNNNNKVMKIAEIFSTVRPYANNKEQETAYEYGSQMYANEHGKKYNKYLSLKNAKKIDELVKELVNVDTGKPMFDTSNPNKIKKAIETLDKQYDGVLKSSIKNRMPTWSIGGFSKGGVIDSKTMATIAESNGDDAWVTVKSGEGILSPADTQNLFALTDAFGKLDNQRPLSTWNLVPRNNAAPSNNVYGGLNIHLDGSDIHDFASFEAAFQNATRKSPKLRNTILDVATSGMTGDANAYMRR